MKLVPHLTFDGNCKEAFELYSDLLEGSLNLTSYGESPAASHAPNEWRDKIIHATLTFSDSELAGADVLPSEYKKAEGFYLLLEPENSGAAQKLFEALSNDGLVQVPLQETFWSIAYASLVDKFGTPWEISCAQAPDSSG